MWVQLHNFPLGMMNRNYGEQIGQVIGEILDTKLMKMGWVRALIFK